MVNQALERKTIHDWLYDKRIAVHDFAEDVEVTPQAVYYWWRGTLPSRLKIKKICSVLNIERDQLILVEKQI